MNKSETIAMKGPSNSGGFNVGNETFKPDREGVINVPSEHFEAAKSHGYKPLDPVTAPNDAKVVDPNVRRAGGTVQDRQFIGGEDKRLTAEENSALFKANAGESLNDDEKLSLVSAGKKGADLNGTARVMYDALVKDGEEAVELTDDEKTEALAAAQKAKGNNLSNAEKTAALDAALEAKKAKA